MTAIMGGAFHLARQIFDSKIWKNKPSTWKIIWIYIIGQVNHKENGKFKRGEGYFNFSRELKNIGNDITYDMIRHALKFFKDEQMISTLRSTRGMIIKVLMYNKYQTLNNYVSTSSSTREAQEKHKRSTPINKNDKNVKNEKNILQATACGFSFKNKLLLMEKNDRDKKIPIIATYWRYKQIKFENNEQYQAGLKRELRPAKNLIGYSLKRIKEVMFWMNGQKEWLDYNLYTVHKYIDKDLTNLDNKYEKF